MKKGREVSRLRALNLQPFSISLLEKEHRIKATESQ